MDIDGCYVENVDFITEDSQVRQPQNSKACLDVEGNDYYPDMKKG